MDEEKPAPASAKPSQVPSWTMLGFVLGALFVLALPRRNSEPNVPPAPRAAPETVRLTPPQMTVIEAVFAQWGQHAVWDNDRTEVALWNPETKAYSDCFEVIRFGGEDYFRSIPKLTRPVLTHGVQATSPLQFTETEEQRQEWLGQRAQSDWQTLGEAVRQRPAPPK